MSGAAVSSAKKRSQMARRVGMAAITEDDIEQNDPHSGIGQRFGQRSIAHARLEHRMRATARELVVAEVDHDVSVCAPAIADAPGTGTLDITGKPGLPEYDLRFAAKRPAREQAAHQSCLHRDAAMAASPGSPPILRERSRPSP